ncbi:MAG: acetoacetate--CoA ligase [Hyphomicrobiaceae bacterium]
MTKPLWQPDASRIARSHIAAFAKRLSAGTGKQMSSFEDVHAASLEDPQAFWSALWDYAGVKGDKGQAPYLADADRMPGAKFFPASRLNYAENLLVKSDASTALVFWGEDKVRRKVSWAELNAATAQFQSLYRAAGVAPGDRVAAIMPNMPEAIAGMLGASATGAIWSSCSPDFGANGVLDRFGQIEPKVLVAVDAYYYNGKVLPLKDKLAEIIAKLPTLERVIIVPYLGTAGEVASALPKAMAWTAPPAGARPDFVRLPFDHPLYILYSSGTTGIPKCIVHTGGGILLKHLSEHLLSTDMHAEDRLFYFSTCGWMMWNWLVSGLSVGATLLLYDGSPFYPDGNVLFDYADHEGMTVFGTSAKYIDAVKKAGLRPKDTHKLTTVRAMCSTGSPLVAESFDYVYEAIKTDIHLASISGGTDICGCFVAGVPTKPVWSGEIQGPVPGMAVEVWDEDGGKLTTGKGELVCVKPFPSMPLKFWNDPDGSKYHKAYFARFPGVWHHGDYAAMTEHGGMIIYGRSDATLNPGGVRIGTAEIYRQVESLSEIQEAIVVGQDFDNDVRVVLFVVLKPGVILDKALEDKIRAVIRSGTTPRHVPARIVAVKDIPRTKSGKITELAVRDVIHGREVKNKEALANPEALDLYKDLPELRS